MFQNASIPDWLIDSFFFLVTLSATSDGKMSGKQMICKKAVRA